MQPKSRSSIQPLGTNADQRRRFLLHHLPLAVASSAVLALFVSLPLFDASTYPHVDIVSGTFPRERGERGATDHGAGQTGPTAHAGNQNELTRHHGDRTAGHAGTQAGPMGHGGDTRSGDHDSADTGSRDDRADLSVSRSIQQLTVATGYIGLSLLAVTLLLGPANLLLRRRNPVSTYLRRDVGTWTAIFSVLHVICAVLIHVSHGRGPIASVVHFFVAEGGDPLTNSFGLGNWAGLVALVVVLGLLATSSDVALRRLKARPWKWLQRMNYVLLGLVILHAFFYGALLRMTSPFTLLLVLSAISVFVGQAVGFRLWRRRYSAIAPT